MTRRKGGGGSTLVAVIGAGIVLAGMHPAHKASASPTEDSAVAAPLTSSAGASNIRLGRRLAAGDYGWTGGQFTCLRLLWTRESGWRTDADETASIDGQPPSYAYGIPQALPASKMASAGGLAD